MFWCSHISAGILKNLLWEYNSSSSIWFHFIYSCFYHLFFSSPPPVVPLCRWQKGDRPGSAQSVTNPSIFLSKSKIPVQTWPCIPVLLSIPLILPFVNNIHFVSFPHIACSLMIILWMYWPRHPATAPRLRYPPMHHGKQLSPRIMIARTRKTVQWQNLRALRMSE